MSKYLIVPKLETIEIEAKDKEDAMKKFAEQMDGSSKYFSKYFRVEDPKNYEGLLLEASKIQFIEWARDVLEEDFAYEEIPEEDIPDIAENAWAIYTRGNGQTEYESIEEAVSEYKAWG